MDYPLTPKQKQVLDCIRQYFRQKGYMPTIRDLCKMTKLAIGTISDHLKNLEKKGWIKIDSSPRGIRLAEDSIERANIVAIPLMGTITAGQPIEAIEIPEDPIILPQNAAKPGSFALRVRGDSMVDDHILDGDLVIVSPQQSVPNGEIAIALLEDGTATLKRVYKERGTIKLQPANTLLKPIYVKRITVQGKVTSILRLHRR